jgi:anti-sigma B factor antagonist
MRVDAGRLRMAVRRDADDVLIELTGELDAAGRRSFRQQVRELLGRGGGTVTVDVGGLRSIDIPGMAALLRADLLLRGVQSMLLIRSATPAFMELLTATGLAGRFRIAGKTQAAAGSPFSTGFPMPADPAQADVRGTDP